MKDAIEAVRIQLRAAADDLRRAQATARRCDASKPWDQSGQTLQQIIDGYQAKYDRCRRALSALGGTP